jgi:hypothetical protein
MSTNAELYEQDFYLWCLETCASLGAREFDAVDVHHLIEEIRDLGNNVRSALESDLGIVRIGKTNALCAPHFCGARGHYTTSGVSAGRSTWGGVPGAALAGLGRSASSSGASWKPVS